MGQRRNVEPLREFVDETPVGEIVVRVSHRLEPLPNGRLRITYAAEIDGPEGQAQEIGPMITADRGAPDRDDVRGS